MKASEVFRANKPFYKTVHVWTAVVKKDGERHNYFMKIKPSHSEKEESKCLLETDNFMVLHECFDPNGFLSIFEMLKKGKTNVCNIEVHFNFPENVNFDPEMTYRYSKWRWGPYQEEEFPFFTEEIRPSSTINLPRNLDAELMSLDRPYSDERDALRDLVKVNPDFVHSGAVSLFLPVYLAVRECSFDEKKLRYSIEFHKNMKKNIDLGVILRSSKGASRRYSKGIKKKNLRRSGDFYSYDDYELVEADVVSAQLALRYRTNPFLSDVTEEIPRPISPFKTFENFCSEDQFVRCLKGEFRDRGFEWSIVTLLTLCGLRVIWTGWTKGQVALGGADLLAFHDDTWIVGECTIGAVQNEKIDRLLQAVSKIRESLGLKELITRNKITPIIFTCSPISESTRTNASNSGVKINGLDDIMRTYKDMKRNKPQQEIVNFITGQW